MNWLFDPLEAAPTLPAAWLVATTTRPVNQTERSKVRRGLACQVVASQTGRSADTITIIHDASGRPSLAGHDDLCLSYANRNGLVIVALAAQSVGADVEQVEPLSDLPWNVLHPQEQAMLRARTGMQRLALFYRLWTAKEACLKANGRGLLTEPSSFVLTLTDDIFHMPDSPDLRISSRLFRSGDGQFAAAVATRQPGITSS